MTSWPVKIVPKITYNVLSGTLSLYATTTVGIVCRMSYYDKCCLSCYLTSQLPLCYQKIYTLHIIIVLFHRSTLFDWHCWLCCALYTSLREHWCLLCAGWVLIVNDAVGHSPFHDTPVIAETWMLLALLYMVVLYSIFSELCRKEYNFCNVSY